MMNDSISSELQRGLGRVEGKLDYLLTIIPDHFKSDAEEFNHIDKRLSKLEIKVYTAASFLGLVSGILPTIISHFLFK